MQAVGRISVLLLWTHALSLVKSKDCKREDFLNSGLYDSKFDTSNLESTYPHGREVRVYCSIGYSGFFKLVCTDGVWTSKGKPCKPISCGHPGDAQFADFLLVEGEDFVFGSKVVYTCNKGYQMVSRRNYRRCLNEGWDGVVPVCEAQQCPFINVNKNVTVSGDPEEATYGNVLRFSCKSKLDILDGPSEIYCNEEGEWSGRAPKCIELTCPSPVIENGQVLQKAKEYRENDILEFRCNRRFKRTEDRPSKCTKVGMRAEWTPMPQCEPTKCMIQLPPLEGTTYDSLFKNVYYPGERLRVTCGEKFWISSSQETFAETTCDDYGQWTIDPVCKEVLCTNRRGYNVRWWNVWGNQRLRLGDTVEYECDSGYKSPDGSYLAKCTRDEWKPKPLCQEIRCERLDIDNAIHPDRYTVSYRYSQKVTYQCREGFTGRPTRTCSENGWTGDSQCTKITCNRKNYPDADIEGPSKSLYTYKEEVVYVCKKGYEGGFTLTCGNGWWLGTNNCKSIKCDRPELINADIRGHVSSHEIQYVCKSSEEVHVARCEEGVWTGIIKCLECPKPRVEHGFTSGTQDNKVYYTCNEGYKLFKKGWWGEATCINGSWSGLEQCIEKMQCGEIPVIPNGKVSAKQQSYLKDESVQILCSEGFQAQLVDLRCQEGEWSSGGLTLREICIPKTTNCVAPPKFDNAIITTPFKKEYLSNSEVVYDCRSKYLLVGESRLQCQDGQWEKKNITCAPYCEVPEDDKIISSENKDKFLDGEVFYYQCALQADHFSAKCVDGKWNMKVECVAPDTNLDAAHAHDRKKHN